MNWPLLGSIIVGAITLIGGVAGVVQIIQYLEQRRKQSNNAAQQTSLITQEPPSVRHEQPRGRLLPAVIPNNLPPRGIFVGREDEKKEIYAIIRSSSRVIVVEGVAGIGKTSLVLEVAYKFLGESLANRRKGSVKNTRFNAFVWITAKASNITIDNVLDLIAKTIDYPYISRLEIEDKFNEVTNLLRENKMLIIIDNFETIFDKKVIQFIENIPEPSKTLITTRYQRIWNTHFTPVALYRLRLAEGLELMIDEAKRLGLNLLQSKEKPLVDLYEVTGGSPLAIKWAMGQMKQRGRSIKSVVATLRDARADIFETMFAESWNHLSEASRQVLLAVPLFAATVSRDALAATANIYGFDFDEALGQLVELWLIESNRELIEEKQRFGVHPLTRSFITKELSRIPDIEGQMRMCAAQYYLGFCNEYRHLQNGPQDYDEIENEVANILRVLGWLYDDCKSEQSFTRTCQLIINYSNTINVFFWSRGYWGERVFLCEQALEASKILKNWSSAGRQAYFIGIVRFWQGAVEEASDWATTSHTFMSRTDSPIDIALTKRLLGLVEMGRGNYEGAIALHEAVLGQLSQVNMIQHEDIRIFADWICPGPEGYRTGQVALMQELGIISNRKADYSTAQKWLENSIVLAQQIGDEEGLAISLSHLGNALVGLQRYDDAKASFTKGLGLATQVHRKSTMGRCNQGLANVSAIERKPQEVIRYGQESINLFERLGMVQEKQDVAELVRRFQKKALKEV
jgi:tetratricopeptide (TPR) repeat protein